MNESVAVFDRETEKGNEKEDDTLTSPPDLEPQPSTSIPIMSISNQTEQPQLTKQVSNQLHSLRGSSTSSRHFVLLYSHLNPSSLLLYLSTSDPVIPKTAKEASPMGLDQAVSVSFADQVSSSSSYLHLRSAWLEISIDTSFSSLLFSQLCRSMEMQSFRWKVHWK